MYAPRIESASRLGEVPLGPDHKAVALGEIESSGAVKYAFILAVFEIATGEPVFFVASEENGMAKAFGGGSHFLGVFDGQGHANRGALDDWGDPAKFFPEAVRIARERFGVAPDDAA